MAAEFNTSKFTDYLSSLQKMLNDCVQFWLKNSIDQTHGGYYNCLSRDGNVYDKTKFGWLQGRQVWMFAALYNNVERFHTEEILNAAIQGAEFLISHIKTTDRQTGKLRCYFSVGEDGTPISIQRTIFSESFYALAMCDIYRATNEQRYLDEAVTMVDRCIEMAWEDSTELAVNRFGSGSYPLNIPLIIMGLLEQLYAADQTQYDKYKESSRRCLRDIEKHCVQVDGYDCIHENVGPNGEILSGSEGHLICPGHAIEAAWFLLEYLDRDVEADVKVDWVTDKFLLDPLNYGWDKKAGGLFYFLDSRNLALGGAHDDVNAISPTQLEWDMKLWWPHNEALITTLMSYQKTRDIKYMEWFEKIYTYCMNHFNDDVSGEWFGYCNREGKLTNTNKGAPFKGFFHVPRCLMTCEILLTKMSE